MSNRRKRKDGHFSRRGWRPGRESRRKNLKAALGPEIPEWGVASRVEVPDSPAQVIKTVPAVVTHPETKEKVTVGLAHIHDDRSVSVEFDEDAPQWAMDYIHLTEREVGYSLETGGPTGG